MEEEDCMACKEWEEHHYWKHVDAKGKLFFRVMVDDFSQSLDSTCTLGPKKGNYGELKKPAHGSLIQHKFHQKCLDLPNRIALEALSYTKCIQLEQTMEAIKKIPKKFTNLMREEFSEIVNLKDPSGIIWHVTLNKTADGDSFQSGWKNFAEGHHLEENDLLLFEYDGHSCFKVKILEGSGCEKAHSHCLKIKNSLKWGLSEDSEEALDITPCRKVNVSSSSNSSRDDILYGHQISSPRKISGNQRKNKNGRIGSKCRKKKSTSNELPVHLKNTWGNTSRRAESSKNKRCHFNPESDSSHEYENLTDKEDICMVRRMPLIAEEKMRALQLARATCSGKPYFVSVMRPINITKSFLTVPAGFKAYLPLENCEVSLLVPGMKKKWRVRYTTNKISSMFSVRWKHFVLDNGLLVGDMCLFELINNRRDKIEMRVKISRVP